MSPISPRIFFDVDGVLADFASYYLKLLKEHSGRDHTPEDITCWDFNKCVTNPAEDSAVWEMISKRGGIHELSEYPYMEVVTKLRNLGYKVRALTSPAWACHRWVPERTLWLNGKGFTTKEIVYCSDKAAIWGDVLVEDSWENLMSWCSAHQASTGFLVDRPWNRNSLPWNAVRVHTPDQLLESIQRVVGHE